LIQKPNHGQANRRIDVTLTFDHTTPYRLSKKPNSGQADRSISECHVEYLIHLYILFMLSKTQFEILFSAKH